MPITAVKRSALDVALSDVARSQEFGSIQQASHSSAGAVRRGSRAPRSRWLGRSASRGRTAQKASANGAPRQRASVDSLERCSQGRGLAVGTVVGTGPEALIEDLGLQRASGPAWASSTATSAVLHVGHAFRWDSSLSTPCVHSRPGVDRGLEPLDAVRGERPLRCCSLSGVRARADGGLGVGAACASEFNAARNLTGGSWDRVFGVQPTRW